MAEFPLKEDDVVALAGSIARGLAQNPEEFAAAPVGPEQLEATRQEFLDASNEAREARIAAKRATEHKAEVLKRLKAEMRLVLRDAENRTRWNKQKLKLLGWGARSPKTRLEPPGQVVHLGIFEEGPGWIILEWDPPASETGTGPPSAYKVQRSRSGKNKWAPAGTAVHPTIVLKDQERGVEWQYRVIAVNRAGEGRESNLATAVL